MAQKLNTKIVPFSRIQVAPSRLRRKNLPALREEMQAIRKYGQKRPLIVDVGCHLLSSTVSYLALKSLGYDFVKVFTLASPSPAAVRAVERMLDRYETLRDESFKFNAALASLDGIQELDTHNLVLELLPVVIADTGDLSLRVALSVGSDDGDCTQLNI